MINDTLFAILISFIICVILCPIFIPILHNLKFGQNVREDGPQSHLKKSGTPTMGGIMIIIATLISGLVFAKKYPLSIPVIIFMLVFGIIGFLDDFLKIKKKKSDGLLPWQKLILQLIATGIFAMYLLRSQNISTDMLIPFTGGLKDGRFLKLGILFVPAVFFIVLGTDNGVNFTDGLDGLCSSVTIVVAGFFAVVSIRENIAITPVIGAIIGALMGFLVYNVHPAKVFMGDTGSLAIGGFIASLALIMQMPLFIVIVGFIYLIEVVSVMIQVTYFKRTGGKRFFKMAPIHHHYEILGFSETRIVAIFSIITFLLSVIAYIGLSL
jgi:phospho-N-acetylmuramoyl-pentapeptide-transferase